MANIIATIQEYLQQSKEALAESQSLSYFMLSQTVALLLEKGDRAEAIRWAIQLVNLAPNQPLPYADLAYLVALEGDYASAAELSQKAADFNTDIFEIYQIHGDVLYGLKDYARAASAYRRAIEIDPSQPGVHFRLGDCLIRLGSYREGYRESEWRMKAVPRYVKFRQRYPKPDWSGEPGTVLVVNEQGLGDVIQYSRYLPELKKTNKVILEVQHDLVSLMKQWDVEVIGRHLDFKLLKPLPPHDYITYFTSLPYWFDPDLKYRTGPYLQVPFSYLDLPGDFKIGICWAGNPNHDLDCYRSCHLRTFAPLAEIGTLFSLQKGPMTRDWSGDLMEGATFPLVDCSSHMADILATGNLIQQLDIVVTVDTVVAHLAGALGKKVLLMISPVLHDRRWKLDINWYPSVKVFQGSWEEMMSEVVSELNRYRSTRRK